MQEKPITPDFSDLDADLDAEIPTHATADGRTFLDAQVEYAPAALAYERKLTIPAVYPCERCRGTGRAFGGICFRCNGSGKQKRRPVDRSPQAVAKRQETRQKKEERRQADRSAYIKENQAVFDWLNRKAALGNNFATSLLAGFERFGHLTDGQITAVHNSIVEDERRAAERLRREVERIAAQPKPDPNALDLRSIPAGRYAVPNGDTRLKVSIEKPTDAKWQGWIFVKDAAVYGQGRSYGKQRPGGTYYGEIKDELRAILSDPKAAAVAYGRLTGTCCICGRTLEDPESIAAGIGPVCAGRFEQ